MKTAVAAVCLVLCSCIHIPEQTQVPVEVLEMAFRSGAISVLEKTNLAVDKAGVIIEETLARDPDGTPVYVTVNGVRFPIYDRRVTVVKGVDFPDSTTTAAVHQVSPGSLPRLPSPVLRGPVYSRPPEVRPPPTENLPVPVRDVSSTRVIDIPRTAPKTEYVQAVVRNADGTYTVSTSEGRSLTGRMSAMTTAPDNSIDVTLVSSDGGEATVRAGGPRAEAFRAE